MSTTESRRATASAKIFPRSLRVQLPSPPASVSFGIKLEGASNEVHVRRRMIGVDNVEPGKLDRPPREHATGEGTPASGAFGALSDPRGNEFRHMVGVAADAMDHA